MEKKENKQLHTGSLYHCLDTKNTFFAISENELDRYSSAVGQQSASQGEIFNDYENNHAEGQFSHAEGYGALSTGEASHAEGKYTNAIGVGAHAEGGYFRRCYLEGTAGVYKVYDSPTSEIPSWLNGYYYNAGSESAIDGQPLDGVKIYNGNYEHIGTITSSYSGTGDDLYIRVDRITGTFTTASENVFFIAWSKAEGTSSHSEGGGLAVGNFSHAEGSLTWAAHQSHAEGHMSASMNTGSHAEGIRTRAHGFASHSEGNRTFAQGAASHAEGYNTQVNCDYSHVQGKYNVIDENSIYTHIVGNGTEEERSNAHTLDWQGNAWFAGGIKVGGKNWEDSNANFVVTAPDLKPLLLDDQMAVTYETDSTYGDSALDAILKGRQILITTPSTGGFHTKSFSPVYMYQLPNRENGFLYLFYLTDEKDSLDLSALGLGVFHLPKYAELKMKLSKEYNECPLQ